MYNYNTINKKVKEKIMDYIKMITGGLNKTGTKFVTSIIFGIISSSSIYLSEIARHLHENITIKKSIDRLSRNLNKFEDINLVDDNYLNTMNEYISKNTLFCVDHSDIVKVASKKLEYLADITDGSKDHNYAKGYYMTEIVALNHNKQPISTSSKIWSPKEPEFKSQNDILFKSLDENINHFGTTGTYIMDRGFDSNEILRYLIKNELRYIIRVKKNRKVVHRNKKKSIDNVILNLKGKNNIKVEFNEESFDCKVSHTKVKLYGFKKEMTLVVMYGIGEKPFKLITNLKINSKKDLIKVIRSYLSRWRIEEYFKFKKQQFNFEKLLVRSIKSIRNLNSFLTYAIGYLGVISNELTALSLHIIKIGKSIKKKVQFWYYQIIRGIRQLITNIRENINKSFVVVKKKRVRNLFTINGIKV